MSTTIDERVVSMKFDNTNFEKNVNTTMGTLEKFNDTLKFKGAEAGMQNITAASNKVDMSGLGKAIETVRVKFSALEVMGVTALANITNSAVNTGKNLVNAFTIAPIATGLDEYETKINAIQTIMANTASKGTTMSEVTDVLADLNTYADKTIYNFSEMTRNIGTFTAAGIGLKDAASSIKGISNLAAASGSNAEQASTAMYQLSQALSSGTVKLMDWNSVVNAGMGGQMFQDALKQTAREHGVAVDAMIAKAGSFRESLQEEWITTDILNETLNHFTVDGAAKYAQSMLASGKYTQAQADALVKQAQSMEDAATKVKTFSQLMDTLKEAAQSGWAQTWETIIGNFDQAKDMFTKLSDLFGGMISSGAKARNDVLAGALDSKWDILLATLTKAGVSTDEFSKQVSELAKQNGVPLDSLIKKYGDLASVINNGKIPADIFKKALSGITNSGETTAAATNKLNGQLDYFQKVVDKVWNGDYDNGVPRIKLLTDAGYDYATVQQLVNQTVDGHRLTLKDLDTEQFKQLALVSKLSDAQLKNINYTDDQIKTLRALGDEANKTGTPMAELIADLEKPSGRTLMLESLFNVIEALKGPLSAINKAFGETFALSSDGLYGMIEKFDKFTSMLVMSSDTIDKVTRVFRGLFSIIKILTDIVGGALYFAFSLIGKVLEAIFPSLGKTSSGFLDMAANAGDAVTKFKDIIEKGQLVQKTFEKMGDGIKSGIEHIKKWIKAFLALPVVAAAVESLKNRLEELKIVGKNVLAGLKNGLEDGSKTIPQILADLGLNLLKAIKQVLGIHSPSTEMHSVGVNTIKGLANGINDSSVDIKQAVQNTFNTIKNSFAKMPWGSIVAGAVTIMSGIFLDRISTALSNFSKPAAGLGEIFESVAGVVKGFGKVLSGVSMSLKMSAIKNLAIAIAILVAAVAVLTFLDPAKVWMAVGVVAAIGAIIVGLAAAANLLLKSDSGFKSSIGSAVKMGMLISALGVSLLLISGAVAILGKLKPGELTQGLSGLAQIITGFMLIIAAITIGAKATNEKAVQRFAKLMTSLAVSLLLMVVVIKLLGGMKPAELQQGLITMGLMVGLVLIAATASMLVPAQRMKQLAALMTSMCVALLLMSVVIKLLGSMDPTQLGRGILALGGILLIVSAFIVVTSLAMGNELKILAMAKLMGTIGAAILVMAVVVRMLGTMKPEDITKGLFALGGIMLMVESLIVITALFGKDGPKIGATILAISVAIDLMAIAVMALSIIDPDGLKRGLAAVAVLTLCISAMILVSRNAQGSMGPIMAIAVAIGVITASVIALSLLDPAKLAGAVLAIGLLMGMFMLIEKSAKDVTGSMGVIIAMSVIIAILATAIILISNIDFGKAMGSVLAISLLLTVLVGALLILDKNAPVFSTKTIIAIGVMLVVTQILAMVLAELAKLPAQTILPAALALSTLLVALAAAMVILSNINKVTPQALVAMGAMGLILIALSALVVAMVQISKVSWTDIAKGLLLIAGVFVILIGTTYALSPVIVVFEALAGGILLIGAAILVAGAGMMLFATSLSVMAVGLQLLADAYNENGATLVSGLTLIVTTIVSLIPLIAAGVANGIIAFATALANGVPALVTAAVALITGICNVIILCIPKLLETLGVLLTTMVGFLLTYVPVLINLGLQLIMALLTGISNNIGGIVNIVVALMTNFILAIGQNVGRVTNAFAQFIIDTLNGVAWTIRARIGPLLNAIDNVVNALADALGAALANTPRIGAAIMDGLVSGILGRQTHVSSAVAGLVNALINSVKSLLGIASPSKVFRQIGRYTSEGLSLGILDYGASAVLAAKKVGTNTVSTMRDTMNNLSTVLSDVDLGAMEPKITPVLDLSNIQNGVKNMDDMLNDTLNIGVNPVTKSMVDVASSQQNDPTTNTNIALNNLKDTLKGAISDLKETVPQVNFNGSYSFSGKEDIDYFMNQAALLIDRRKG